MPTYEEALLDPDITEIPSKAIRCNVRGCGRPVKAQIYCSAHANHALKREDGNPCPAMRCTRCRKSYIFYGLHMDSSARFCPSCFSFYKRFAGKNSKGYISDKFTQYGIDAFGYGQMWLAHDGACALCRFEAQRLIVDHDHECCLRPTLCGQCIRGLLCTNCNFMIGHYESVRERLKIDQFEEYRSVRWRNIRGRMVKQYVTVAV